MSDDRARSRTLLSAVPLFATLTPQELEDLAAVSRWRRYPRGQVVFSQNDPGDSLVIVAAGRLKVVVRSADGGELMLALVGPGGQVGEVGLVDGDGRSADAETLEVTELLFVPADAVNVLLRRHPEMAQHLLVALAANLRRLTDATADLVFLDLPRRLAKLLVEHSRGAGDVVELGMSQEQIAHRVAATRQSVNQALRGFERRGWIALNGSQVAMRKVAELARFAGLDLSAR